MSRIENVQNKALFVYDLEFIGNIHDLNTCKIWDMAFLCVETGERFCSIVDPDPTLYTIPPPVVEGLFPLTREYLSKQNAKPFHQVWPLIVQWIVNRSHGKTIVLISHNNFCSDKPVLENHISHYFQCCPIDLYFFDSLVYFRDNLNTYDYSLKGLVRLLLKREHDNAHRAEIDTIRLYECLNTFHMDLKGYIYSTRHNSLRTIRGIGASLENNLMQHGIFCEEQLFENFRNNTHLLYNLFPELNKKHITMIEKSMINRLYGY